MWVLKSEVVISPSSNGMPQVWHASVKVIDACAAMAPLPHPEHFP
jgi:hypothetical protein